MTDIILVIVDPACDAAVASLAQILLELGKAEEALGYYEMAIGLARTQPELEHAISYVEATKAQIRYVIATSLKQSCSNALSTGSHKNILKLLQSCELVVVECKKTRCKKISFRQNIEAFLAGNLLFDKLRGISVRVDYLKRTKDNNIALPFSILPRHSFLYCVIMERAVLICNDSF